MLRWVCIRKMEIHETFFRELSTPLFQVSFSLHQGDHDPVYRVQGDTANYSTQHHILPTGSEPRVPSSPVDARLCFGGKKKMKAVRNGRGKREKKRLTCRGRDEVDSGENRTALLKRRGQRTPINSSYISSNRSSVSRETSTHETRDHGGEPGGRRSAGGFPPPHLPSTAPLEGCSVNVITAVFFRTAHLPRDDATKNFRI